MNHTPLDDSQPDQSFWGINPKDKIWFIILTGTAGAAWSAAIAITAVMNRMHPAPNPTQDETISALLTGIATGTAGAFAAAGFGAWLILNVKDAIMSIADAIRKHTAKRTEAIRQQGIQQGQEQGIQNLIAQAEAKGDQEFGDKARKYAKEINQNGQPG